MADRTGPAAISIGALIDAALSAGKAVASLLDMGTETVALSFWQNADGVKLEPLADEIALLFGSWGSHGPAGGPMPRPRISALSCYGNVLGGDEDALRTRASLEALVDMAPRFGSEVVGCFAGRLPGKSVPDSLEAWKLCFGPLAELAAKRGVTLAFEGCRLGDTWKTGKWNIAINPDAWTLMFDSLPGAPLGLEWEPSHQILSMADPLVQLEAWADRIVHVHAKDAHIDRASLAIHGIFGSTKTGAERIAGRGDTDWASVFSILGGQGYHGAVDVEIGADPEFHGGRELEGIGLALSHLRSARAALGPSAPAV